MKINDKHSTHLSDEQLQAYLKGELTQEQCHYIERHILTCVYCSEALSGMELMQQDLLDFQEIKQELSDLLHQKTKPKPLRKIIPLWQYAAAASVLLVMGLSWFLFKNPEKDPNQVATVQAETAKPLATDSIVFENSPEVAVAPPLPKAKENANQALPKLERSTVSAAENKQYAEPKEEEEKLALNEKNATEKATDDAEIIAKPAATATPEPTTPRMRQAAASPPVVADKAESKKSDEFSGRVFDKATRQPLAGATISANDRVLTQTDTTGRFEIAKPHINEKLEISHQNFEDYAVQIKDVKIGDFYLQPIPRMDSEIQYVDLKNKTSWKYNIANHPAMPTGGWEAFLQYLNPSSPSKKEVKVKNVETVVVECLVDKNGALSNFKILKNQSQTPDETLIERIKTGPTWLPRTVNGTAKKQKIQIKF